MLLVLAAVAVIQTPGNPDRMEGTVDLDAPSGRVLEVLSDYEKWPEVFSDVRSAKLVPSEGETLVRLDTKTGGHPHTFRITKDDHGVSFEIVDGHGGKLKIKGEFRVEETATGSRVESVFETHVGGWVGRLFSDSKIRKMARQKLERDLKDLANTVENAPKTARR